MRTGHTHGRRIVPKKIVMVDITHKTNTLRSATAFALVEVSDADTMKAVREGSVPKGNVFDSARTAGLLGIKRTADTIPDCHPLPVEHAEVEFDPGERTLGIKVHVKAIYRTGVEVEAMHGASVVALTVYDMLKPLDEGVRIGRIEILEKRGGMSSYRERFRDEVNASLVVCSDTVHAGKKEDRAGKAVLEEFEKWDVQVPRYEVIPDEPDSIREEVKDAEEAGMDMLVFVGGTGLSARDRTPETIRPMIDREVPGIAEAIRSYGQERTPYSMLSRSLAGVKGNTLILALPGSSNGALESVQAIFPFVLHVFGIMKGKRHE